MRLYHARGGWYGTQAHAREDAGKVFEQVEVPTDKDGLLGFLNKQHDQVRNLEDIIEELRRPGDPLAGMVTIEEAEAGAIGAEGFVPTIMTQTDVEEFIQHANPHQLVSLTENLTCRLRELAADLLVEAR